MIDKAGSTFAALTQGTRNILGTTSALVHVEHESGLRKAIQAHFARHARDERLHPLLRSTAQPSVAEIKESVLAPIIAEVHRRLASDLPACSAEALEAALMDPKLDGRFGRMVETGLRHAGLRTADGRAARLIVADEPMAMEVELNGRRMSVPARRLQELVFDHHGDYAALPQDSTVKALLTTLDGAKGVQAQLAALLAREHSPADLQNDGPWQRFIRLNAGAIATTPGARDAVVAAASRVNSTLRLTSRLRVLIGKTQPGTSAFNGAVATAEAELGRVSTTNLGDGVWSVWVGRNIRRLAENPRLLAQVEKIQQLEDFDIFKGPSFFESWKIAGVKVYDPITIDIQFAVLDAYDRELAAHGVRGADRIGHLPADVQADILRACMRRIDDVITQPLAATRHAERFRGQVQLIVEEAQGAVADTERTLMAEVRRELAGEPECLARLEPLVVLDDDRLKARVIARAREAGIENPVYPVFADWVAGAEAFAKAAAESGRDIGAEVRIGSIAIPGQPAGRTFVLATHAPGKVPLEVGPFAKVLRDQTILQLTANARAAGAAEPDCSSIARAADLLATADSNATLEAAGLNEDVIAAKRALATAGYALATTADHKAFLNAVGQRGDALVFRFPGPGGGTPLDQSAIVVALAGLAQ